MINLNERLEEAEKDFFKKMGKKILLSAVIVLGSYALFKAGSYCIKKIDVKEKVNSALYSIRAEVSRAFRPYSLD